MIDPEGDTSDTNGCAGLSKLKELASVTFTLSADGSKASLVFPGESKLKAVRVST